MHETSFTILSLYMSVLLSTNMWALFLYSCLLSLLHWQAGSSPLALPGKPCVCVCVCVCARTRIMSPKLCVCVFLCMHYVTSVVSDSVQPYGLQPARILCPWDSPGENNGMSGHVLLQGIFPTQGLDLYLLRLTYPGRQIVYH